MTDDTLIIGAGIIGLLTARTLLQQGQRVRLLDAGAARPCASWAAGGILSPLMPWRYDDAVTRLTCDAVSRYQTLASELLAEGCGDPQVDACGLLVLTQDAQQALAWGEVHSVKAQVLLAQEVQADMPASAAAWFPALGALRNSRLLTSLRESLQKQGLVPEQTQVISVQPHQAGWQAHTNSGVFTANQVVVAAGAWSAELLKPLGVSLPVMPVKGQMALYRLPEAKPRSVVVTDAGYLVPRRDGLLLLGSTLETQVSDMLPSVQGEALLAHKWQALQAQFGDMLQGAEPVAQWAGWRPGNVTDVPFIGEAPSYSGLFVCTGHYRNGICAAPASVELLVAQLLRQPLPFNATPYALSSSPSSSLSSVSV